MICLHLFANRYNCIPYYIGSLRFWWLVAPWWPPPWFQWWRCLPGGWCLPGGCLPGGAGGRLPGSSGGGASLGGWWLPGGRLPGGVGGASLVPVVEVPPLVAGVLVAGGCLPGGAGGASLVPRPHIHSRTRGRGHARLLSAAALSLVNRSCKESLLDAIALIINYLGFPFGMAFTGWLFC